MKVKLEIQIEMKLKLILNLNLKLRLKLRVNKFPAPKMVSLVLRLLLNNVRMTDRLNEHNCFTSLTL